MKALLDLAVRTFCGLWESADIVTASTPWSWEATKNALKTSPRLGEGLLQEWEKLDEPTRNTTLRILAEFHPLRPEGDVVQFKDPSFVQRFHEAVVATNMVLLNDHTVDVIGGPKAHSLSSLAKDCGGTFRPSILQEHYISVDTDAPCALLSGGLDAVEAAKMFSGVITQKLSESDLRKNESDEQRFAGRMSRFARPRRHMSGRKALSLLSAAGGQLSAVTEGHVKVSLAPKKITSSDIDPRDITERKGTARYTRAVKLRVKEANAQAELDAQAKIQEVARSLVRDHASYEPVVEGFEIAVPVQDETVGGVPVWLIEEAKSHGYVDVDTAAKLLLAERKKAQPAPLVENEGGPSVGSGGAAKSASGDGGERGGVSHEQPDVKGGRTAQSQSEPPQEPEKPTEHVPDHEEGDGTSLLRLSNGIAVPEPVMKDAVGKLLQNLGTQLQQGIAPDGMPPEPQGDGEPEEDPAAEEPTAEEDPNAQNGVPQPTNPPAETAVSGPDGTGKMAEAVDTDAIARKLLSGEMTVAEAMKVQSVRYATAEDLQKGEMEEDAARSMADATAAMDTIKSAMFDLATGSDGGGQPAPPATEPPADGEEEPPKDGEEEPQKEGEGEPPAQPPAQEPAAAAPAGQAPIPVDQAQIAEAEEPQSEYVKAYESKVRQAVAALAGTDVPQMVWEGVNYGRVRKAILAECRGLSLTYEQVADVRRRLRRMEEAHQGRVYALDLSEGDRALLLGVSLEENDAAARVVQAASDGLGVSERTLAEACSMLSRYGELEHRLLAEALNKMSVKATVSA